jgi:hypothetical protein
VLWLAEAPSDREPGSSRLRSSPSEGDDDDEKPAKEAAPKDAHEKDAPAKDAHAAEAHRIGIHAFSHYRRFVEEGGTIVVAASDKARHFLVDGLGFEACGSLTKDAGLSSGVQGIRTRTGDLVTIDLVMEHLFESLDPNGAARELWTAADPDSRGPLNASGEQPFAVAIPEGSGSVVLLASDAFLANRSIGAHDHALAAVRLAEDLGRGGRILFDEYALGLWQPETALGIAFSPKLLLASLHAILLLGLFAWMQAFVRAFPRDPEPYELFSPLLRARAFAALFVRAGRPEALARLLRRGVFDRLCARARLRPLAAPADEARADDGDAGIHAQPSFRPISRPGSQAVPRRIPQIGARVVTKAEIERLATASGLAAELERLHDLFVARAVRRSEDLAALDADLRSFERWLGERDLAPTLVDRAVAAH